MLRFASIDSSSSSSFRHDRSYRRLSRALGVVGLGLLAAGCAAGSDTVEESVAGSADAVTIPFEAKNWRITTPGGSATDFYDGFTVSTSVSSVTVEVTLTGVTTA